ncbi:MAG TPA: OprD family outer membrane porin [Campylobacterales bacterium]|nr:OprD family outer membrane porin [Campylobacterales bacterium]
MKKVILSFVVASTVATIGSFAASDVAEAFKEGKVSGQVRAFYINRGLEFDKTTSDYSRDGLAIGGKIGFETAPLFGVSAGAVFYTTNKLDDEHVTAAKNDKTLFDGNDDSYSTLGQAYIQGKFGATTIKVGRQQLDTPLASSDDGRMIPNLFEAAVVINGDLPNTTLIGAHVKSVSYGTFANAYGGGELALISGYGNRTDYKSGTFLNMGKAALGDSAKDSGVTAAAVIYKGVPGLTLQVWDYYAHEILNALYAQADYSWKCLLNPAATMTASAQYIKESDMHDTLNLSSAPYYAAQLALKAGNFNAAAAYSSTGTDNSSTFKGGVLTPWGGMPAFTQGMVTRHQFMADTTAYKLSAGYNLKDMIRADVTANAYYASFNVDSDNSYTKAVTTSESGFDIIYNNAGIKNLQLRLRGNFPNDFRKNPTTSETTSWSEYRVIANYNF